MAYGDGAPEDLALRVNLDTTDRLRWEELSRTAQREAGSAHPARCNAELEAEASRGNAPATPAYLLWSAENLAREGRYSEAVSSFDRTIDSGERVDPLIPGLDFVDAALHHKASAAAHDHQTATAIGAYRELAARSQNPAGPLLEAGITAERVRLFDEAAALYGESAEQTSGTRNDDPGQRAQRALRRLGDRTSFFSPSLAGLVNLITEALEDRDASRLRALASGTHFAAALGGAHLIHDSHDVLDHLAAELSISSPELVGQAFGTGDKRYLMTSGWRGEWFRGRVAFLLVLSGRGWQWSGIVVSQATEPWIARWRPDAIQTNQPLAIQIGAPWPASKKFKAGGLNGFIIREAEIVAAGVTAGVIAGIFLTPLGGVLVGAGAAAALTEAFSLTDCGFGVRGFYYNTGPTHDEEDAFAIDFTTYRKGVPYDNESGGTPVLAVADGVVQSACSGVSSGDSSASNTVEIMHPDPSTGTGRYLSRYLHLAGPSQVLVSMGMAVRRGDRLGLMNDTGNSAIDHLHFSIHDQTIAFPGAGAGCGSTVARGASVRPTPMDGQSLDDDDDGKCLVSRNFETGSVRTTEGKITMLRVHELGTGFGPPSDFVDGEVIVQVASAPGESFGLRLRRGRRHRANRAMLDMLRDAFAANEPVRLEFERTSPTGRKILRIIRTQTQ